jgi:hypothetical protein
MSYTSKTPIRRKSSRTIKIIVKALLREEVALAKIEAGN